MKEVFTGIAGDVLIVTESLVYWIEDFLRNQQAIVIVHDTSTKVLELQHAGLPQGSLLSPILYILFNANLVKSKINKNRKAIAFIDNYSA